MPTTYYAVGNTAARMRREADGLHVEIYDKTIGRWRTSPGLFGLLTGIGGDCGPDEITEAQAESLIRRPPGPEALDGPPWGHGPDYGGVT